MGTYNSDSNGGYATFMQKDSLEDLILYLAFKFGLLEIRQNQNTPGEVDLWANGSAGPKNLGKFHPIVPLYPTSQDWGMIFYGHNEFTNKRCPCFKMKNALGGTLGKNLNDKLKKIKELIYPFAADTNNYDGLETLKASTFLSTIKPASVPSPYRETDNFDGVGEYVDSN